MNDPALRYVNNNNALLHFAEAKNHLINTYQSPSIQLKAKSSKDNASIERPKSNKMRYVVIKDLSGTIRSSKNPLETADKKYSPLVTDKKQTFNMTFHNLSNIYKAKDTPPKKTPLASTKKTIEKPYERLTFYQQMQSKAQKKTIDTNKQSIDYSNYPSSRQNSRAYGQEENAENIEKRPVLKNNLLSQRDFADLLTDVKNLPYVIKGMGKYAPAKTTKNNAQPFSNNSSFYNNHEEDKHRNVTPVSNPNTIEQQTIDEKRIKLNQEDYSPNKVRATPNKESDASKKAGHRRGYSMGQQLPPEKNAELEKQIEKHMQYQYQQQQLKEQREREAALQAQYQQQLLLQQQQQQKEKEQQTALQLQYQQQNQLAILDPQQEQDDYYAQFFNTNKMTFDFERQIISQRGKSSGSGLFTPMASPANATTKKPGHHRTASMGEEPKSSSRWQNKRSSVGDQPQFDRQNSELVELINMMENPEEKAEFVQYIQDRGNFEQVMSLLESRYRNERYHHHK